MLKRPTSDPAPEPELSSHGYWKSTSGYSYQEAIRRREREGNRAYAQQEALLTRLVAAEHKRLGRPVEILEFGCGFGRHAAYLSAMPEARYYGYDFSESMLEPLRAAPPPGLPVAERIFSGPEVGTAVGGRKFDLVFTVSVCIHNPPEVVPQLIAQMGRLTRDDGLVTLIENQVVPFSVFENEWHRGCWLHAYATYVPQGWDVGVGASVIESHGVYVFKRSTTGHGASRVYELRDGGTPREDTTALDAAQLAMLGLPKLQAWAHSVQPAQTAKSQGAPPELGAGTAARLSELEEGLNTERRRRERQERLLTLADQLAELRANQARKPRPPEPRPAAPHAPAEVGVLVDHPTDRKWAHVDPALGRVVHICHQEWFGIRAATGYLPGRKLAITADRPLTVEESRQILAECGNNLTRTIVFQGFSENAERLMVLLRKDLGTAVRLAAVWHGSTTQFHMPQEREGFLRMLALKKQGVLDTIGSVKPQLNLLSDSLHPRTLLNLPPRLPPDGEHEALLHEPGSLLIPTPNNYWKNFYSNLYPAILAPSVKRVYVISPADLLPMPERSKVVQVGHLKRAELFRLIRQTQLMLNVTLAECQPMSSLEALAHGVPCLTGPLSLDVLDAHPYQQLVQVAGTGSLEDIRSRIEQVLGLTRSSPAELQAMLTDYTQTLVAEGLQRFQEFAKV